MATHALALFSLLFLLLLSPSVCQRRSFVIDKAHKCFLKDGQPFQYISGSIHYFRVPRAYWKDRLRKMRLAGLNTVASYVEWSGHEPQPGMFNFLDNYDVVDFCKEVQREGLLLVLRVGPYICAERDNGGLPYWLYSNPTPVKVRTIDKVYMTAVEKWLDKLLPMLKPIFYKNGGPVIALQVENEYGSHGCYKAYLTGLYNMFKKHVGDDVILFTNDYWLGRYPKCGGLPGVPKSANMYNTDNAALVTSAMNKQNPQGCPVFLMELYVAWFTQWGSAMKKANPPQIVKAFKHLMSLNVSVNFYVFHGGTNFGFTAASLFGRPMITSYDYAAPLSEAGDPTDLYYKIRDTIKEFVALPTGDPPVSSPKLNVGAVRLTGGATLVEVMDHFRDNGWLKSYTQNIPITFEKMSQDHGFVMYTSKVSTVRNSRLVVYGIKDRAYVVTSESKHVFGAGTGTATTKIKNGETLTIIVENEGREDFKPGRDRKGITGAVKLGGVTVRGWTMEPVPIVENRDVSLVMQFLENKSSADTPGFFHGTFILPPGRSPIEDTFLDPTGWTKGVAFINGINLGRYWPKQGPQVTLYLPGAFLLPHPEENRLFLLEMEGAPDDRRVKLVDKHVFLG
ncbi:unnamed protein product [Ixodes hexagonus]